MIYRAVTILQPDGTPDVQEEQAFIHFMRTGARIRSVNQDERVNGNFRANEIGSVFELNRTPNALEVKAGWQVMDRTIVYEIYSVDDTGRRVHVFAKALV